MWEVGKQEIRPVKNYDGYLRSFDGDISETEAKVWLVRYLRQNLGFATELIMDVKILPMQEIFLNAMFKKDNSIIVAGRGIGKSFLLAVFCPLFAVFNGGQKICIISSNFRRCSDRDTLVLTQNGFNKINDVNIGDTIFSGTNNCKILNKWENAPETGIKLITKRRYEIIGLKDHKVLIFNKSNISFEYKSLEEIGDEDIIPIFPTNNYNNEANYGKYENDEFSIDFNDNDFYYFLGSLIGDGCVSIIKEKGYYRLNFSNNDLDSLQFFENYINKIFKIPIKIHKNINRTNCNTYYVNNKKLCYFLQDIGLKIGRSAIIKDIPSIVLKSDSIKISHFLSGLFDTDGSCSIRKSSGKEVANIKLASSSEILINQTQQLLLNFGIFSSKGLEKARGEIYICGKKCIGKKSYFLRVENDRNVKNFFEKIGFRILRKRKNLDYIYHSVMSVRNNDDDLITIIPGLGKYLKDRYMHRGKTQMGLSHTRDNWSLFLLKKQMEKCKNYFSPEDNEKINKILSFDKNIFYDKVQSKEEIETKTIDIEVNNDHCYWGNGFINHNSRAIMQQIEKFVNGRNAPFLRQCFRGNLSKLPDCYSWTLHNGSEIRALPLSGDGIRGERATVLVVDEALLISKHIKESIIDPFLTSRQDMREQMKINEIEDELISRGLLAEKDRTVLSRNKTIMMSSASFEFEYLYKGIYVPTRDHIIDPKPDPEKPEEDIRYSSCAIRASYEIVPRNTIMDDSAIQKAKKEHSQVNFDREYRAIFVNASGSYFNIKKLHECTVQDGDEPTTRICGFPGEEFILAIDPSYSASKSSDYFSMGVYLIDKENRRIIQVHSYGRAGVELKNHYLYLTYILKHFNIVWISIDASGTEFLDGYNESTIAKENNIRLEYLDVNFDKGNYVEELSKLKSQHNIQSKKIVYPQQFNSDSIRAMNQYLQSGIDAYKVWFASRICSHDSLFKRFSKQDLPMAFKDKNDDDMNMITFLEEQDDWIYGTKMQLAMIEVKATILGTLQFDLPKSAKNSDSPDRPRRDNYTCLLMGYMASRYYFDLLFTNIEANSGFEPFFL